MGDLTNLYEIWSFGNENMDTDYNDIPKAMTSLSHEELDIISGKCRDMLMLIVGITEESDLYDPERASVETYEALDRQRACIECTREFAELSKKQKKVTE